MKRCTNKQKSFKLKVVLALVFSMLSSRAVHAVNYRQDYDSSGTKTIELVTTTGNKFKVYDNGVLNAAEYDAFGPITVNGGGTLNIIFSTTAPVNVFNSGLNYGVYVTKGTVNISLGSAYSAEKTLTRGTDCTHTLFYVNSASGSQASCVLNINGNESHRFIVDGMADMTITGSADTTYVAENNGLTSAATLLTLSGNGGCVNLSYVDFVNNWSTSSGGAIALGTSSASAYFNLTLRHCLIEKCYTATSGAAWNFSGVFNIDVPSTILMEDCLVQNCFTESSGISDGGTIRTWMGPNCDIVLRRCDLLNNKSHKRSGGIMYNLANSQPLLLDHCLIDGNWGENGGGLQFQAAADLVACTITNNYAQINGGGICNRPYDGGAGNSSDYAPHNGSLVLDENTIISNNEARENGGGVFVNVTPTTFRQGYADEWTVYYNNYGHQFKMSVKLEGATITNNKAKNGGGIFLFRDTDIYQTNIILNRGLVENNIATEDGGSCYVNSEILVKNYPDLPTPCPFPIDSLNMYVSIGSAASDDTLKMVKNEAVNGGGVYVKVEHDTTFTSSMVYTSLNDKCIVGTEEKPNIARGGNGGGVYVNSGVFTMTGGEIAYNQAKIENNEGGNGGAFYVSGPQVEIKGGTITRNHSDLDGGGFYVDVADNTIETKINSSEAATTISYNTAQNGGGAYVNQGHLIIQDAATTIANDTASIAGGGIYLGTGNVTITDATLSGNVSQNSNGGGYYVANGSFTANNAAITSNHAPYGNGGGVYAGGNNGVVTLNAGTTVTDNNAINGGGICVDGGNLTFTNAVMTGNTASNDGGGFYTTGGEVEISGNSALIGENTATVNGGGMFIGGDIELQGGVIKQNQTGSAGGGVYVTTGGDFTMTGGTIGGTTAEGNQATGTNGAGGGLYMAGGTATISGGAISGNSATMNGGGVFMFGESASCTLSNNAVIGGDRNAATPDDYANTADYGAGIYSAGGVITVKGGSIAYNHANLDGGGIYSAGSDAKVYIQEESTDESYVDHNTADRNGGGVFASLGEVYFSNGNVQYNFAENAGGGMYVDKSELGFGELFLTGNAKLEHNHVPSGKKGGGIYLLGKVTVGAPGEQSSVTAENNYADAEGATITDANRNNIYLPNPEVRDDHTGLITVVKGCINTTSKVGFSVPWNHVPVIYCEYSEANTPNAGDPSSHQYLNGFTTGEGHPFQYVLFEDSHRYISVHYTMYPASVFHPDHVYLYGFWPEAVTSAPAGFNPTVIRDERDLAWLISVVNGRYDEDLNELLPPNDLDGVTVTLQKDLDMREFGWVPVGMYTRIDTIPTIVNRPFKGIFNGNGYTIEGINGMVYGYHNAFGLFGLVEDAEVGNVFIKDAEYFIENNSNHVIGGLVGISGGNSVIGNSEVSSHLVADNADIVIGGLVGRLDAGTVHSAIAIPDMEGGIMGGLVGELAANGDLLNSFANAKFTTRSDASAKYQGGLAAVNRGRIENCYYHEQKGSTSTHSGKFGSLVGDNTSGTVNYSYAASEPYSSTDAVGTLSGHGCYADNTEVPYLYRRRDNQVTLASGQTSPHIPADYVEGTDNPDLIDSGVGPDKQMLLCLNNWVESNSGTTAYARWSRPTTKVINDDLPLLLLPSGNAVAATTGDPYLEYGSANTRIANFRSLLQAVYMYRTQTDSVVGNGGSDADLYIDEHVALIQKGELKAHVGITLDNSAGINGAQPTFGGTAGTPTTDYTDWHMFATPLNFPPLGIKYVKADGSTPDDTQWHGAMSGYAYYDPAGMPCYQFYDKDFEGDPDVQGYFPSHAYGSTYSNDNSSPVSGGAYYNEWDFYCYYEPEYHWINFKRNGNDHWHENAGNVQIEYRPNGPGGEIENEEYLIPGKGYLVATRENNTFLQAKGTLNSDEVTFPVTRSGVYSPGYNLLGNPYQAYLDFERFATTNRALWNGDTPSYYILDEGSKDYVAYVSQGSTNPARPEQFIHPHQGFMVLLNSGEGGTARFTPDMRNIDATTGYRDARPAYPLVNLFATEQNGNRTMVTVELGRPDKGGAAVLKDMHVSRGKLYCRYEGDDYEIAFTRPGLTEAAIRFETLEDTEYTMTWDTHNGEFTYLHLIDNLTGADVDCLAESEYRFTSRTSDYKSRFRLVFGYSGIDEPETPEANDGQSQFAFMMGDELVVNGEGTLQLFDISGRQVMSADTHGTQTTLGLPRLAAGVYTLRMTTAGSSQAQKIVIR